MMMINFVILFSTRIIFNILLPIHSIQVEDFLLLQHGKYFLTDSDGGGVLGGEEGKLVHDVVKYDFDGITLVLL